MKKGQMKISFGMIFSILLIVAFLAFAFFGIKKVLEIQDQATYLKFQEDLKEDINTIYIGSQASKPVEYTLSKKVEAVCFTDNPSGNLAIYYSDESLPDRFTIPKIDLAKTLGTQDKLCFPTKNNRINLVLEKDYGENLITIRILEN